MEHMTPWGIFWVAFFGCLSAVLTATVPTIVTQILAYKKAMAELRLNTTLTAQSHSLTVDAANKVVEVAEKVDSSTRNQASTASAAASIAKVAAKDAKETAMDAKLVAGTTTTAVENLSLDVKQLKEIVNGYLTQRLQEASRSGYAMGVSDTIGKTVEEHGQRIGNVETKLAEVQSDVKTVLEIVKNGNGDRSQVRGESR